MARGHVFTDTDKAAAERIYLELGADRSLHKVQEIFSKRYYPVAPRTVYAWSVDGAWVEKSHDWDVEQAKSEIAQAAASATYANVDEIDVIRAVVRKAALTLLNSPMQVRNAKEALSLARLITGLKQIIQLADGEVTERKGVVVEVSGRAQDALRDLEAKMRARPMVVIDAEQPAAAPVAIEDRREVEVPTAAAPPQRDTVATLIARRLAKAETAAVIEAVR